MTGINLLRFLGLTKAECRAMNRVQPIAGTEGANDLHSERYGHGHRGPAYVLCGGLEPLEPRHSEAGRGYTRDDDRDSRYSGDSLQQDVACPLVPGKRVRVDVMG